MDRGGIYPYSRVREITQLRYFTIKASAKRRFLAHEMYILRKCTSVGCARFSVELGSFVWFFL